MVGVPRVHSTGIYREEYHPSYPPGCIYREYYTHHGPRVRVSHHGPRVRVSHHGARESTIPTMEQGRVLYPPWSSGIHHPPWSSEIHHPPWYQAVYPPWYQAVYPPVYTQHVHPVVYPAGTPRCIPGRYTPLYTRQVPVVYPAYTPLLIPGKLLLGYPGWYTQGVYKEV